MSTINRPIAYFTNAFPALSHTFISNEVKGLRNLGVNIKSFSVHKSPIDIISEEDRDLLDQTFYIFPLNVPNFFWSHIYYIYRKPRKYFGILFFVLTRKEIELRDRFRTFYHFCEAIYMARKIERDNIKHIHVHFVAGAATSAMIISKLLGISFSFTAHGTSLLVEKLLLDEKIKSAKFIIAISNYNKNFMVNIVPESAGKIFVVHCGIDPNTFLSRHQKTDTFTILSVGRLTWQKGYSYLIEACNFFKKNGFQFHCAIIGEGPERKKLAQLIHKYRLEEFVSLNGKVFQNEIRDYYDLADIFVSSSVSEGIPVVLMEAMSMEIPVIATRIAGIPELVEHYETGILIPPKDVKQLVAAILLLINHHDLKRKLAQNGRKKILKDFNLKKNLLELKTIFESQIC